MERDPILLAEILHEIAKSKYDFSDAPLSLDLGDQEQDVIDYHLLLLAEGGLIIAKTSEEGRPRPVRLTWKGHDYLEKLVETAAGDLDEIVTAVEEIVG